MYVSYVVRDRASKSKHQQLVSGASPIAYWLSVYCWDFIVFLVRRRSFLARSLPLYWFHVCEYALAVTVLASCL